jgi:ribokinase
VNDTDRLVDPEDPASGGQPQDLDVLVVGSINTDLVVRVPTLPRAGETTLGSDLQQIGGGKGANQAVAAARLGASTAFLGCVGNNDLGSARVSGLESNGIAVDAIVTDAHRPTGAALILVDDDGENVIAVSPGANAALTPSHVSTFETLFARAGVVVCQLEIPRETVEAALRLAREHNAITVLNAAPGTPAARSLLKLTDVLIVNQAEAASLLETPIVSISAAHTAAKELCQKLGMAAILTLGIEGSVVATRSESRHVPAYRVPTVDGTAAGDAFVGAITTMLAQEKELDDALQFATAAAAIAVGRFGAQPSLPTQAEVAGFLKHTSGADPTSTYMRNR